MPDLSFELIDARSVLHAASPLLALRLRIVNCSEETIHSILLRCQVQIEATRRNYEKADQPGLYDIFGEPANWNRTLRTLLWTHLQIVVPTFSGETTVEAMLPCPSDFNVLAAKYFHALGGGTVPICLLFSGTIFYEGDDGRLQAAQVDWNKEANFTLPVSVWQETVAHYFPNIQWFSVRADILQKLNDFKRQRSIPTLEQALERLLDEAREEVPL